MVALEFQAVVFAGGRGTRFSEIIGDRPKCLLPIGPFPLVWYPLNTLQKHGFEEAILVVIESQKSEIQQALERLPLKLKLEYATIPADSDFGTADALKHISDRIKTNIIALSCDVVTNVSLFGLLNVFRQHDAGLATLLLRGGAEGTTTVPGPKMKHIPERDLIALHPETKRLLFLSSTSDFEETMSLPGHLLRKRGKIAVHSRLVDSHIYIMKKWVVDFLSDSQGFSTLKGELLPYIVKKQMSRPQLYVSDYEKPISEVNLNMKIDDIFDYIPRSELDIKIRETSIVSDYRARKTRDSDLIKCYAVTADKNTFGIRVNTILGYCAANQKIFKLWETLFDDNNGKSPPPSLISPYATINSTQITECAVAENTTISAKTSLKSCVFGANCVINAKVRITDSVIMNNVVIEEGVILTNCVICSKAVIKSGTVLKDCLIGHNFVVPENTKKEKEHLTNADGFMEIE